MTEIVIDRFEDNVEHRGPYGYLSGEQRERRVYSMPSGEQVLCTVRRLSPKKMPHESHIINLPSGNYFMTREYARGRVRLVVSKHDD